MIASMDYKRSCTLVTTGDFLLPDLALHLRHGIIQILADMVRWHLICKIAMAELPVDIKKMVILRRVSTTIMITTASFSGIFCT